MTAVVTCQLPNPTSLGLATLLVEGEDLMLDSPSFVAGEEGCSSPVPSDRRGRCPHHSGAGLLRPVIPATCATVSLDTGMMLAEKTVSDSESDARSHDVRSPAMSASSPVSKDADTGYLSSGSLWPAVSSRRCRSRLESPFCGAFCCGARWNRGVRFVARRDRLRRRSRA